MGMPALLKFKLRALLVHFGLSVLVFLPFLYLIWFHWYPPPLFFTDGGWQGLRIMVLVDLVLGPSLTFLIFNPAKTRRALGFDFLCIGIVQASALAYGAYNVESVRPWVMSFSEGAFHVTTREPFAEQTIEEGGWERLGEGPLYRVYVREPANEDEAAGVTMFGALSGVGPEGLFFLYEPLARHLDTVKAAALDMEAVVAEQAVLREDYKALRKRHEGERLWFLPLYGYFSSAIVAIDADGHIVDALYHEAPVLAPKEEHGESSGESASTLE